MPCTILASKVVYPTNRLVESIHFRTVLGVTGPVRFYDNERKASILLKQFQEGEEVKVGEYSAATQHLDLTLGKPLKWIGRYIIVIEYIKRFYIEFL